MHADAVAEILTPLGASGELVAEVQRLVTKAGIVGKRITDAQTQAFEDVVCLVFLETQYDDLIASLGDDDKMVDVLRKTFPKMSPAALALAPEALPSGRGAALVARALEPSGD